MHERVRRRRERTEARDLAPPRMHQAYRQDIRMVYIPGLTRARRRPCSSCFLDVRFNNMFYEFTAGSTPYATPLHTAHYRVQCLLSAENCCLHGCLKLISI